MSSSASPSDTRRPPGPGKRERLNRVLDDVRSVTQTLDRERRRSISSQPLLALAALHAVADGVEDRRANVRIDEWEAGPYERFRMDAAAECERTRERRAEKKPRGRGRDSKERPSVERFGKRLVELRQGRGLGRNDVEGVTDERRVDGEVDRPCDVVAMTPRDEAVRASRAQTQSR